MVPGFHRDGVWIPAFAGMTVRGLQREGKQKGVKRRTE
jgi:hypothetical protein